MAKIFQINSHTSNESKSVQRILEKLGQKQTDVIQLNYGNGVKKLTQYHFFRDNNLPHPEFTTDPDTANQWLKQGHSVVCRKFLQGQEGHGITVVDPGKGAQVPENCKIFTKYLLKKKEFRVNIFKDRVVNVREKVKKKDWTGPNNPKIRSLENGFTFIKCSNYPNGIEELALQARKVSESDFIGVDIGYNQYYNKLFLLEVNSGPAIEGSSVEDFCNAIINYNY